MHASRTLERVTVIGAGIAGSEAAWQLAQRGIPVTLVEMRPTLMPAAHHTPHFAELVCSNSFKSSDVNTAAGLLKAEIADMGSIIMNIAAQTRVPAGGALAVDRDRFGRQVTEVASGHPLIDVVGAEQTELPAGRVIIATGPLTSSGFEPVIAELVGDRLAFHDAAAPIVDAQTLDRRVIFEQSRYDKGGSADYLNAPMDRSEYEHFIDELLAAKRVNLKEFERDDLFQACQPIEEIARAGRDAPRFGPLKPVGLTDPRTGERPWAVVQLRAENAQGTAYNLVGFQTNLTFGEQKRVFSLIPGLEAAEFLRFGVMHRNTFIDAPRVMDDTLALRTDHRIRFAGQITGTEGYTEAAATGLLAALNTVADMTGSGPVVPPATSALGSLLAYASSPETADYQPMHVNFGLVPPLPQRVKGKRERYAAYSQRAREEFHAWWSELPREVTLADG